MSDGRSGVAFLDKPPEMTSFQALRAVKQALGSRRVGHAGTLDRFATGLLVVLTGAYTRLAQLFSGLDKVYQALVEFGAETDTLDPEGRVVAEGPLPALEDIERAARSLRGPILQVPPVYSALHVEGRRAHELSRAGAPPRMTPRPVTIHSLELRRYEPPVLELEVRCSKGTYIRALARDLAAAAGSRAHLRELRRTAIGPFRVEEAVSPEGFSPLRDLHPPWEVLGRLEGVGCRVLEPQAARAVRTGRPLDRYVGAAGAGPVAVFDEQQRLLALAERDGEGYRYLAVFREERG